MNTKLLLVMLMITAVILFFEAETISGDGTRCIGQPQCADDCRAKGCSHGRCVNAICRCMYCGK
uniref:AKTx n=1 Tax=Hadrurus spadix TaxID=141984 RepID=A0A1W7RB45_9SCOR